MPRKRATTSRKTATTRKPRKTSRRRKSNRLANVFVPMFFIFCILSCLGFMLFMGYQSATASSFFDLQAVAVRGVARTSRADIEKIVETNSASTGVWHADIGRIKHEVERLKYVRTASVSRVLPNKFRVLVNERIPRALVRIDGSDFWVDEDGLILSKLTQGEKRPLFTMFGWDTRKTTTAHKTNKQRVALFSQLKKEWNEYDLVSRVRAIDLSDMRDPRAIVLDSGETVTIYLGKEDFRKGLQRGLENIAGRGKEVESIIVSGERPIIEFRDS